ncbi:dTDP-4-dehydrorhamnose reductase [Cotonvirus japonicus]|uniref:dTDP-4-dehydrorhamnose reductase n=1 Tax=Cotonvirus japonicus TaxID=2811091 RepID=A0ABM7NSQ1_9VIRU|nr:dTDP-4-dehydrorhamnose reductase [Cotonvirus japonicus]BCS83198.1 dTDP-4-dehydrorhamnose reductase [Cotonvirus japonicus]
MKIIVFGSNGMLGNYMVSYFNKTTNVVKIDRTIFDAFESSNEDLLLTLQKYQSNEPTFVINCIGIIPQRNDLDQTRKYIKINSLFPHLLANCCEKLNYKMIHVSTDCVYDGKTGNYNENSVHDETNIYGISKSLGEPTNCCVIRTSIIGEEINNKKSLLEWVRSQNNKEIGGFTNHFWNGVTCLQLAKIINYMLINNIYWQGVKHIFSPNIVSKYQLIKDIIKIYDLNIIVKENFTPQTVDKTLTSIYPNFITIPTIREQIEDLQVFELEK